MGEKKPFTCQNPACKTTFTVPLKTLNLQDNPAEPYYACPRCLTKVAEVSLAAIETPSEKILEKTEKNSPHTKHVSEKLGEGPSQCGFHLGYLGEREPSTPIPDDCLLCKSIVDCMLKRMHEEE